MEKYREKEREMEQKIMNKKKTQTITQQTKRIKMCNTIIHSQLRYENYYS